MNPEESELPDRSSDEPCAYCNGPVYALGVHRDVATVRCRHCGMTAVRVNR